GSGEARRHLEGDVGLGRSPAGGALERRDADPAALVDVLEPREVAPEKLDLLQDARRRLEPAAPADLLGESVPGLPLDHLVGLELALVAVRVDEQDTLIYYIRESLRVTKILSDVVDPAAE